MGWLTFQTSAEELTWLTDVWEAQHKAKAGNKLILLNFTGSDWCGWCIKLKKEVFDTPEFVGFARKRLVLVEVDFPMRRELPPLQRQANEALQNHYKVQGYPTLIILDSEGRQLGQMGYQPGGPKPFLARLNKFRVRAK